MVVKVPEFPPISPSKGMGEEVPNVELDKRIKNPMPDVLKTSKDEDVKFTDLPIKGR